MSAEWADFAGAVAWPLVALVAVALAFSNRGQRLIRPVLRRLRGVSAGGFALELSEQAAIATKADVQGTIQDYADRLREQFERLEHSENVRHHMVKAMEELFRYRDVTQSGIRATVHIADALYVDALYQLVDYWPGGRGGGRRFSTRFGILGRAWRLQKSEHEPSVPTWTEENEDGLRELIREWGMTREQATSSASGRKSFVCVLLEDAEDTPVGILYLDAEEEKAFVFDEKNPDLVIDRLEESPHVKALGRAVGRVHAEIAKVGPGLRLLHSDE